MLRKNIWLDDDIKEIQDAIRNTPDDDLDRDFTLYQISHTDKDADFKEERRLARKFLKVKPNSKLFYHWF